MGVPLNHAFIDEISIINNLFRGNPIYGNPHILFEIDLSEICLIRDFHTCPCCDTVNYMWIYSNKYM